MRPRNRAGGTVERVAQRKRPCPGKGQGHVLYGEENAESRAALGRGRGYTAVALCVCVCVCVCVARTGPKLRLVTRDTPPAHILQTNSPSVKNGGREAAGAARRKTARDMAFPGWLCVKKTFFKPMPRKRNLVYHPKWVMPINAARRKTRRTVAMRPPSEKVCAGPGGFARRISDRRL